MPKTWADKVSMILILRKIHKSVILIILSMKYLFA